MTDKRTPLRPHHGDGRYLVALYNLGGENVTGRALAAELSSLAPSRPPIDPRRLYDPLERLRKRGLVATVRTGHDSTLLHSLSQEGREMALHESSDVAAWKAQYDAGKSTAEIAESSGHKVQHVREALKAMGVKLESGPRRGGRRGPLRGPLRNATQGLFAAREEDKW